MADQQAQQQQLQQFRAELQNQMVQGTLSNQLRTLLSNSWPIGFFS
jgi:hypothetical protein